MKEIDVVVSKLGGVIVGSEAARRNGIDVTPSDIDIQFRDAVAMEIATIFLQQEGWKKVMIDHPQQYMRNAHSEWKGRMAKEGQPLAVDLFVGGNVDAKDGIATNMEVLRGHMVSAKKNYIQPRMEYIKKIIAAIVGSGN